MEKNIKGKSYLGLCVLAGIGLGLEVILAFLIEQPIYGLPLQEWSVSQNIIHWVLTCLMWGTVSYFIVTLSKSKLKFDIFEPKDKIKPWQWICTVFCVLIHIAISYISWNGSKVYLEFLHNRALKFIFQYIYYLFETMLFMLIIVFGQKACEVWFKNDKIPYGGIACTLIWGLPHWLTKGDFLTGIISAISGFMFGIVYLIVNRNIKWTYLILSIMFML